LRRGGAHERAFVPKLTLGDASTQEPPMKRSRQARTTRAKSEKTTASRTARRKPSSRTRTSPLGKIEQRIVKADPEDLVSFSLVVAPASGATLADLRRKLSIRTLTRYQPDPETRRRVETRLAALGFEVFAGSGFTITARGPVRLFTKVFGGQFVKRLQTRRPAAGSGRVRTQATILLKAKSELPSARAIPGVLLVSVAGRPKPAAPSLPPQRDGLHLYLPGHVAQVTRASATHRRVVASGDRATGGGVKVAVIDSGFADHPYFGEHDYRITRMSASDEPSDPSEDDDDHGTFMLAGLLACAPEVHVLAIKYGANPINALQEAFDAGAQVISLSWGYDTGTNTEPMSAVGEDLLPLLERILHIVQGGVTVVAAAGNDGDVNFPASIPEVVAVGGVAVDEDDAVAAWAGASSFASAIFAKRRVPDLCGIASAVMVPLPPEVYPDGWEAIAGATSLATVQVAGIAALLLQKSPALTPEEIREHLTTTATDVKSGTTASLHKAKKGRDLATGFGLVNALDAWNSVP
jgi:hypothetical protein